MTVATFDTLKFANTLKAAGVPSQQAEAQAVAFAEVIQLNLERLATTEQVDQATRSIKADLDALAKQTKADLDALAKQTKADLDALAKQTKADLDIAVRELRQELKELRQEFKQDIVRMDGRLDTIHAKLTGDMNLLRWMFGALVALNLTVVGLVLRISLVR